jgi:hypothetical protein
MKRRDSGAKSGDSGAAGESVAMIAAAVPDFASLHPGYTLSVE